MTNRITQLMVSISVGAILSTIPVAHSQTLCPNPVQNTVFVGYDIGYNVTSTADDCYQYCVSYNKLCTAYSYLPGNRCFIKSSIGQTVTVPNAVSCSNIQQRLPTTCPLGLVPCNSDDNSGACALFSQSCSSTCGTGNIICPDGVTCLPMATSMWSQCPNLPTYLNTSLSLDDRLNSLVNSVSLYDISWQLINPGYGNNVYDGTPGIPALQVPPYNFLNEGLHGVARSNYATSMPQISVIGQTFNRTVFYALGRTLGLEARIKHIMYKRANITLPDYTGITYYAPNINLGRSPVWGRIQEVPTECPYVMGEYGALVVNGAQSSGTVFNSPSSLSSSSSSVPDYFRPPAYLVDPHIRGTKAAIRMRHTHKNLASFANENSTSAIVACCKHAVGYSVEEYDGVARASFNAIINGADMLDSYLPAFQECFMTGGGASSMCSYNAVNGVPTCASAFLLNTTIRQRYGRGNDTFVMSDYSAIADAYNAHHYCSTNDECVALTLKVGVDQDGGGNDYLQTPTYVQNGLLTDGEVRQAVSRLFKARLELGILDPAEDQPYQDVDPMQILDTDFHRSLSLEAATQGIVLLTNNKNTLPLNPSGIRKIAIIGPNADVPDVLYGNYQGTPPYLITPRQGFVTYLSNNDNNVYYAPGCYDVECTNTTGFAEALTAVSQTDADAVFLVLGIDQSIEAEGKDRSTLALPGNQELLAQEACAIAHNRSVPCILVYINGGPISNAWVKDNMDAILLLGYASQSAGTALVNIVFGISSPAGKLAVTWPAHDDDVAPENDMGMRPNSTSGNPGRTYRFNSITPLFPFGYGLTYTTWTYTNFNYPSTAIQACDGFGIGFTLTNTGTMDSGEVIQVYLSYAEANVPMAAAPAIRSLVEFERVFVPAGQSVYVNFTIPYRALALVNSSAAATFGQDFALHGTEEQENALHGRAFGLDTDYYALSQDKYNGQVNIGWDDMFIIPQGVPVSVYIGNGQPGYASTQGLEILLNIAGPSGTGINLAQCDMQL